MSPRPHRIATAIRFEPATYEAPAAPIENPELVEELAPILEDRIDLPLQQLVTVSPEWVDVGVVELRAFTVDGRLVVRARVVPDSETASDVSERAARGEMG